MFGFYLPLFGYVYNNLSKKVIVYLRSNNSKWFKKLTELKCKNCFNSTLIFFQCIRIVRLKLLHATNPCATNYWYQHQREWISRSTSRLFVLGPRSRFSSRIKAQEILNRTIELTDDRPRQYTNQKLSERILSTGTNVPFSTFWIWDVPWY